MNKQTREIIVQELEKVYGAEKCGLDFTSPFELLIATILSAQCTDVRVNVVTKELFKEHNTPKKMLCLNEGKLKNYIKTCGLANSKAKNILLTCHKLLEDYNGVIPHTMDELIKLPGVGRKTANVVMSNAFNIDAIAVDTHVFRVSKRLGLSKGANVLQVEKELMKNIPKSYWSRAHHWIIWHGRKLCSARSPKCMECFLNEYCDYFSKQKK